MLLNNLAEPSLTFIHCNRKYVRDIFCSVQGQGSDYEQIENTAMNLTTCEKDFFRNHTLCYSCSWSKLEHIVKVPKGKQLESDINTTAIFLDIFDAVETLSYPPIISPNLFTKVYFIRFLNIYTFKLERASNMTSSALTLVFLPRKTLKTGGNLFLCKNSFFISILYLCNGIDDCPEGNDEMKCDFGKGKVCSTLFYMTSNKTCKIFMYKNQLQNHKAVWFSEFSGQRCVEHGMLACMHRKVCYPLSRVCVYELNKNGILFPCHHGEHLQLCKKFESNMMFKCPGYYCIFWGYTCNGRWDCPFGSDETNSLCDENKRCANMFKCKTTEVCIHLGDLCDGTVNCPQEDDEQLCTLNQHFCPPVCICLALAMQCVDINLPVTIFQK